MRIPRCYIECDLTVGTTLPLDERLNHYLIKVLRVRMGAEIILFNGCGNEYQAKITELSKKHITVHIKKQDSPVRESPLAIHLFQAITRGERMDYSLQKSVELGVTEITPILTERTEVHIKPEKLEKKLAHWRGIITSAAEQSGRVVLPTLHPPCALNDAIQAMNDLSFILEPTSTDALPLKLTTHQLNLLIGPEGGFSPEEIDLAKSHLIQSICLGPRILRTETATAVGITALQWCYGDLNP